MHPRTLPFSAPPAVSAPDLGLAAIVRPTAAGGVQAIEQRLAKLDREWDIDRVRVEAQGASAALTGLVLGFTPARWLPRGVARALLGAQRGWTPPLGLIRAFGVRSAGEIARERDALLSARADRLAPATPRHSPSQRPVWTPLAFDAAE